MCVGVVRAKRLPAEMRPPTLDTHARGQPRCPAFGPADADGDVHPLLCFVLMPFGKQRLPAAATARMDFEVIYRDLIKPAVEDAGLKPIRADQELQGGIFHKRMFERLSLCEYAVADLSLANPNVFYELGIRHARRPWSTVLLFQRDVPLPLDVALASAMPYALDQLEDLDELERLRSSLTRRLQAARSRVVDSPVFQLVAGLPQLDVEHTRLDAFAKAVLAEDADVQAVARAALQGIHALVGLRGTFGDLEDCAPDVVVALLKAFRDQAAWEEIVTTIDNVDTSVAQSWIVQELRALALGRLERFTESTSILNGLLDQRESSETYGLLGGTFKRQWRDAVAAGQPSAVCTTYRRRAADAYRLGFEADSRDPYPGVNAVMLAAGDHPKADDPLLPVVEYAVARRLARRNPEYWDYICALELAVVRGDRLAADECLGDVLIHPKQPFDPTSTTDDLRMLLPLAAARKDDDWVSDVIAQLEARS